MTLYPASIRDLLANLIHAARVWARDPDRRVVCPVCKCRRCGHV